MTKEEKLLNAFDDENFQKELTTIRLLVETKLLDFLEYLKANLSPEQRIFDNIESRVKSRESFREKLHRKDYLHIWDIKDDIRSNQTLIAKSLPDLIGFRINCFFWPDERIIYDILYKYYTEGNLLGFTLDFTENKKQGNGHIIYKLTGKYEDSLHDGKLYSFEIQIKSIMHNIWGEVDHKTIYKSREYDVDSSSKKVITEELFHILQASDKQLLTLLTRRINEKHLLYALFFGQTKEKIVNKCGTDILASHYTSFFDFFENDKQTYDSIKEYVAKSILGAPYNRRKLQKPVLDGQQRCLKVSIAKQFYEYNLRCIFQIFNLLFSFSNDVDSTENELFETFLDHLTVLAVEFSGIENDQDDEEYDNGEFDSSDETYEETEYAESFEDILNFVSERIGGRKND